MSDQFDFSDLTNLDDLKKQLKELRDSLGDTLAETTGKVQDAKSGVHQELDEIKNLLAELGDMPAEALGEMKALLANLELSKLGDDLKDLGKEFGLKPKEEETSATNSGDDTD